MLNWIVFVIFKLQLAGLFLSQLTLVPVTPTHVRLCVKCAMPGFQSKKEQEVDTVSDCLHERTNITKQKNKHNIPGEFCLNSIMWTSGDRTCEQREHEFMEK